LSQKIYLDDCAYDKDLVRWLEQAGHQVVTPAQAGITGRDDDVHFHHAATNGLVLLTMNPQDFVELHQKNPQHPGILLVYKDNDPNRDMSPADIVRAIGNLEDAGVTMADTVHVLNAWRY
jgi:predicted nuclease of predicted toxin-antitoxin system